MREARLIKDGSPCDTNLYADGPQTFAEARAAGRSPCPHLTKCEKGLGREDFRCVMMMGRIMASSLLDGNPIEAEIREFKDSMQQEGWPKNGFIFSRDRKEFVFLTDRTEIVREIESFANTVLGDQPETTPRRRGEPVVGGSFESVVAHSIDPKSGAVDLLKMQALEGRFGRNGGRGCDTNDGPCSCGAWH